MRPRLSWLVWVAGAIRPPKPGELLIEDHLVRAEGKKQRQQVTDAFARYTIATWAGRFSKDKGEKLQVTGQLTVRRKPVCQRPTNTT